MTPGEREELARGIMETNARAFRVCTPQEIADAIAPIIERLVAERVAAETERCAGIVPRRMSDLGRCECGGVSPVEAVEYINEAIRSATR